MTVGLANQNVVRRHPRQIIGIGAGPSNLSFAALAQTVPNCEVRLLEKSHSMGWHRGMQVPDAELQVSFLKDLVTLVDPTSRYSFLCFLKDKKRMYRALVANRKRTSRLEFEQYLQWAAEKLGCITYGVSANRVDFDGTRLNVRTSQGSEKCDIVVIGSGLTPKIPDIGEAKRRGIHSSQYMMTKAQLDLRGKSIAVVGGGQSGAEIVLDLLVTYGSQLKVTWINKRLNLMPLDDSPFINEQFFPGYIEYFERLSPTVRGYLHKYFCHTSDGISPRTLEQLYAKSYDLQAVGGYSEVLELKVGTRLTNAEAVGNSLRLHVFDDVTRERDTLTCDHLFLATGYGFEKPKFLDQLISGELVIRSDRSIEWEGQDLCPIYIQNTSVKQFSLAEPNLSLLAWRSAMILNSITGEEHFDLEEAQATLRFAAKQPTSLKHIAE